MASERKGEIRPITIACEGPTDYRFTSIVARELALHEIDWLEAETVDQILDFGGARALTGHHDYIAWKTISRTAQQARVKIEVEGVLPGRSLGIEGTTILQLIQLVRPINPEALIVLRDCDGVLDRRSQLFAALEQTTPPFPIAIGTPQPTLEAWYFCAYFPEDKQTNQYEAACQEAGLRLAEHAHRCPRVKEFACRLGLTELVFSGLQPDRWPILRQRGAASFLTDFLDHLGASLRLALR